MEVAPLQVPDVLALTPTVHRDARGWFLEAWNPRTLEEEAGIRATFVQDNLSCSRQGVLRGLHLQNPTPQGKLVRAVQGEVFDVAVDLRRGSPTFGRWAAVILSEHAHNAVWIPRGFAHGFYVLSEKAVVLYKVDAPYAPRHEHVLRWDDPEIAIPWPLLHGRPPLLSPRDAAGRPLSEIPLFP